MSGAEAFTEITIGKQVYSPGNCHHGCYEGYSELAFPIKMFISVEKIGKYMESYFFFNLIQNYYYEHLPCLKHTVKDKRS